MGLFTELYEGYAAAEAAKAFPGDSPADAQLRIGWASQNSVVLRVSFLLLVLDELAPELQTVAVSGLARLRRRFKNG